MTFIASLRLVAALDWLDVVREGLGEKSEVLASRAKLEG